MAERCDICGREIFKMHEHIGYYTDAFSPYGAYRKDMPAMGGRCGSCGRLCCKDCFRNGVCPACSGRLKKYGGSHL